MSWRRLGSCHEGGQPWRNQYPSRCERSASHDHPPFCNCFQNCSDAITSGLRHTKPPVPSYVGLAATELVAASVVKCAGAVLQESFERSPPGIHPIERLTPPLL